LAAFSLVHASDHPFVTASSCPFIFFCSVLGAPASLQISILKKPDCFLLNAFEYSNEPQYKAKDEQRTEGKEPKREQVQREPESKRKTKAKQQTHKQKNVIVNAPTVAALVDEPDAWTESRPAVLTHKHQRGK